MSIDFYRSFEDRYRGSRELIHERLKFYLPFIESIGVEKSSLKIIDIGCGRGEWLELLRNNGINDATGIDIDTDMLRACEEIGLKVHQEDAVHYISKLPYDSFDIISAFHFIEHVEFNNLEKMIEESYRVLRPGGLLILETPNADNLVVGCNNFYLDPSHKKPIPSQLLAFINEYYGFNINKIMGLHGRYDSVEPEKIELTNVLNDVSPDYAILSRKPDASNNNEILDNLLEHEYGTDLYYWAKKYDKDLDIRISESTVLLDNKYKEIEKRVGSVEADINKLNEDIDNINRGVININENLNNDSVIRDYVEDLRKELNDYYRTVNSFVSDTESNIHKNISWINSLQEQINALSKEVQDLKQTSDSNVYIIKDYIDNKIESINNDRKYCKYIDLTNFFMKINAYLKKISNLCCLALSNLKKIFRPIIVSTLKLTLKNKTVAKYIAYLLKRTPRIKQKLKKMALTRSLINPSTGDYVLDNMDGFKGDNDKDTLRRLSKNGKDIYIKLRKIENNQ